MNCTVNICTRLRPQRLKETIRSVLDTATYPDQIQFTLRADCDDKGTLTALPDIIPMGNIQVIVGKPLGYTGYPIVNWDMCKLAEGEWIWHFDDDATMKPESKGWDEKLMTMPKHGAIILPEWDLLGGSGYHRNSCHPFMWLPNRWWEEYGITEFSQPFDDFIFKHSLRTKYGWETYYLDGVSTWHQRRLEDALNQEQKRF
jgi:hypothetical protein